MPKIEGASYRTRPTLAKAAGYTVTEDDAYGGSFTNEGAGAAIAFALPPAKVGMRLKFYVGVAFELRIDPSGTQTIALPSTHVQGGAGKYLTADAIGEWVQLECQVVSTWSVTGFSGTWTAEA